MFIVKSFYQHSFVIIFRYLKSAFQKFRFVSIVIICCILLIMMYFCNKNTYRNTCYIKIITRKIYRFDHVKFILICITHNICFQKWISTVCDLDKEFFYIFFPALYLIHLYDSYDFLCHELDKTLSNQFTHLNSICIICGILKKTIIWIENLPR